MAKKDYKAGDTLVMRTRKDEDPIIFEWANIQDEIGDAIRYLIEEEIRKNGLRNLAEIISRRRPPLSVEPEAQNQLNQVANQQVEVVTQNDKKEKTITENNKVASTSIPKRRNTESFPGIEAGEGW